MISRPIIVFVFAHSRVVWSQVNASFTTERQFPFPLASYRLKVWNGLFFYMYVPASLLYIISSFTLSTSSRETPQVSTYQHKHHLWQPQAVFRSHRVSYYATNIIRHAPRKTLHDDRSPTHAYSTEFLSSIVKMSPCSLLLSFLRFRNTAPIMPMQTQPATAATINTV